MTKEQKDHFEIINNSLWLLLKGKVKNEKAYKDIMSELFNLCFKHEAEKNKFSDEWWDSLIDLYNVPEKYKQDQELCGFGANLADDIYDWFKMQSKGKNTNLDFYFAVCPAFIKAWEAVK